jgi:MFS family permease
VSDPDHVAGRPATFREVLASVEFRAIFCSTGLSTLGDAMARAAVTALVYQRTHSALFTAATFAIGFLPWLGLGSVLAALAERYPYRRTMIVCDIARMVTVGLVAVPRMPLSVLLLLLFVTAMFDPPFTAARSALIPRVVQGERYVLSLSLIETTLQLLLVVGYFAGGAIAAYDAHLALLFDSATFGISACVIGLWVHHREPALRPDQRRNLLRETADGFTVVFGGPVLRSIAIVIFASLLFPIVPEGLAAAWAGHLTTDPHARGWMQGVVMCSMPMGFGLGSILINRFVRLTTRQRLIRPFAVLAPLALVVALVDPDVYGVALISATSGFAVAALLPAARGLFVEAVPDRFRARAFGVMQSGVLLCQGFAVLVTGALSSRYGLPLVVGLWGAAGVVLMLLTSLTWPRQDILAEAIDRARRPDEAAREPEPAVVPTPGGGATGVDMPATETQTARSDEGTVRDNDGGWSPMPTASR